VMATGGAAPVAADAGLVLCGVPPGRLRFDRDRFATERFYRLEAHVGDSATWAVISSLPPGGGGV